MNYNSPVFIDGLLYVLIAVFGSILGLMANDDTYKYINPYIIFWFKFLSSVGLATATALKMFRSTAYSDHLKQNENSNTNPPATS